jgi:prevent-host-death family protein
MKTATISQTRNALSALLDRVRQGETIVIIDRSRPVARLEPVIGSRGPDQEAGRLARLERAGLIRRGQGVPLDEMHRVPPPRPARGGDVVAALVEERRGGR